MSKEQRKQQLTDFIDRTIAGCSHILRYKLELNDDSERDRTAWLVRFVMQKAPHRKTIVMYSDDDGDIEIVINEDCYITDEQGLIEHLLTVF